MFDRTVALTDAIEAAAEEEGGGVPMATYLEARMLAHNTAAGLADAVGRARAAVAADREAAAVAAAVASASADGDDEAGPSGVERVAAP